MIDQIRHNAELVRSVARDQLSVDVGFDRAGVEWLDGFVNRQHEQGGPNNVNNLVNTLGSCILDTYGGEWFQDDSGWCVRFDEKNAAYPFAKLRKHLLNGAEDSVLSMFDTIPVVFKQFGK